MNPRIVLRGIFALALALGLLLSAGAQAQAFRTYLSGSGNDGNSCTLAAPCRLLPRAIATVIDGGEVWMLDSANYNTGPVSVNKSVTILAVPGALGSVVALGGDAIDIATPGVKVALRNLVIVPFAGGGGTHGIYMPAGASFTVENCLIANLPLDGIYVTANGADVLVMDTVIRGNGHDGLHVRGVAHATVTRATISENNDSGVTADADAGITSVDVADSTMSGNYYGVFARAISGADVLKVSVRNSQIVGNTSRGILATIAGAGASTTLSASNNIISNNGYGIVAQFSGAKVWVSGNTVSDNAVGFSTSSGSLFESAGDNAVRNNGAATSGAITYSPLM